MSEEKVVKGLMYSPAKAALKLIGLLMSAGYMAIYFGHNEAPIAQWFDAIVGVICLGLGLVCRFKFVSLKTPDWEIKQWECVLEGLSSIILAPILYQNLLLGTYLPNLEAPAWLIYIVELPLVGFGAGRLALGVITTDEWWALHYPRSAPKSDSAPASG